MSANRRRLSPALSGEGFSDILPEDMIEEILLRLPFSSVFALRSVSTPWLSLTTSRYFLQRWELHHSPFHLDRPLALLLQDSYNCTEREFFLLSGVPEVKFSGFSLDFLPGFRLNGNDSITVMGSCEDLLLCCNRERFQSDYFVVNPITRQWVALPPPLQLHEYVLAGFVCEPASIAEARKGGDLRYRVVRIPIFVQSKTEFNIEIFSSEDGQWNEYAMRLAERLRTYSWFHIAVACNGILYWRYGISAVYLMGLDPFNPNKKGIYVISNAANRLDMEPRKYVIGICRGKLRMSEMLWSEDRYQEALRMNIWELDYGEAKWQLVQVVRLQEILAVNSSIVHPRTAVKYSWWTLAFHPNNIDIIYFYLKCTGLNKFICCNSKRMSLKIVTGCDFIKSFGNYFDVFPFPLPWWPTPVSAMPKLCDVASEPTHLV